jgi:hypothetical protein
MQPSPNLRLSIHKNKKAAVDMPRKPVVTLLPDNRGSPSRACWGLRRERAFPLGIAVSSLLGLAGRRRYRLFPNQLLEMLDKVQNAHHFALKPTAWRNRRGSRTKLSTPKARRMMTLRHPPSSNWSQMLLARGSSCLVRELSSGSCVEIGKLKKAIRSRRINCRRPR